MGNKIKKFNGFEPLGVVAGDSIWCAFEDYMKLYPQINKYMIKIEDFLLENDFEIDTYYGTNKRYMLPISESQTLYVRILSDANEIMNVEYESIPVSQYETYALISFDTIDTIEQLKHLIKAIKPIDGRKLFKCDVCGDIRFGLTFPIVDENFNKQHGLNQCEDCYQTGFLD